MAFADLLAYVDRAALRHLGSAVGYKPEGGASVSVYGIFDAAYVKVDAGNAGVSSCGPAIFLKLADLPSDPSDDNPEITVAGVAYQVKEAQPDGLGGVLLQLRRAAA